MTYHLGVNMSSPDFFLDSSRGVYNNVSSVHKFGAVPAMSQNQSGTIWDINDTDYPWSSWSTATTVTVDRASASDTGKQIVIEGLDSNYEPASDTVTLTDATGNASTQSFIRVFRAYMHDDSATNVGNIDIKVSTTTVARITAEKGQTLMAVYTVPAGHSAYLMKAVATCQDGADATGDMFIRYFGETSFRIGHTFEVCGDGGPYEHSFGVPFKVPSKSDIDVRASVRSNNARITAAFDIILISDKS